MFRYRNHLPQLDGDLLLTDAGLDAIRAYYRRYLDLAQSRGVGFVLESPTWRASRDWGCKIGYHPADMAGINRRALALMTELRAEYEDQLPSVVISGCVGPRGDGYDPEERMSAAEAAGYHRAQLATFAAGGADLATAFTIPYVDEALGMARAAAAERIPLVIGFTVETDGLLPSGETLEAAIARIDGVACTTPAYYMINCAHPDHFARVLEGAPWAARIRAVRANASAKSHAELDEAVILDEGDPLDLGERYRELARLLPNLAVIGGCCGTDLRHVGAMCEAVGRVA